MHRPHRSDDDGASRRGEIIGILITIILIALFIVIIFFWIYVGSWNGKVSSKCNNFRTCDVDLEFPNGMCTHNPAIDGTYCGNEDVCYNSSAQPYCFNGICTADTAFCNGFCFEDSDCPILPISPRLDNTTGIQCLEHSCVYTIVGGFTAQCLTWINETEDNPLVSQGCLVFRFTDAGFTFPPGICFIRFQCAPFDFRTLTLSIKNSKQQNLYNDSIEKTMSNMKFLKDHNIDFIDIPIEGYVLTRLRNSFENIINNSIESYKSSKLKGNKKTKITNNNFKELNHLKEKIEKSNRNRN